MHLPRRALLPLAAGALALGLAPTPAAMAVAAPTPTPTSAVPGVPGVPSVTVVSSDPGVLADATDGPCAYTPTPDDPAVRPVSLPRDPTPTPTPHRGTVLVTFVTNRGSIPMELDRAVAPCTVQSFLHLLRSKFYDDTICHRLTTYPTLSVLQCGDPSGTGAGGPGYRYEDELPTFLPPSPTDPTGERVVYPRGTLAMANAGPDTNGSQFFLVWADSVLRPNYTVFGRILPIGLRTLDRIAAGGVRPQDPGAPLDGRPAKRTHIEVGVRIT
ncbi:peptidyl-prolyl cis-trans isomerase B (cyclophilin B) [Terracoccus luteus]|uniref:Peptidyl-prolyl cis-trans isomerase n=1 Tax=Terracoccus luteus TaxID=53356 RepID=A0A495XXP9_9MICO|nr:peptidylprolyl isomerase [Terracoccus luteus]RKT77935.1 peptidyl-prolyl cis-trans isomerase B (cyclophilin B) [Terracoccus luteus]